MRATEYIEFLNMDEAPTAEEKQFMFSHISTEDLMEERRLYRLELRRIKKAQEPLPAPPEGE